MKKIILFSLLFLMMIMPFLVFAQNPVGDQWIIDRINNIINRFVWPAFWGIVLIVFLWIGFMYLRPQGEQDKTNKATLWAMVGIIIALLGFSAINIINRAIGGGVAIGACCTNNGNTCTDDQTHQVCASNSGVYQGDATTCRNNPCLMNPL